jgi:hypothetical protein
MKYKINILLCILFLISGCKQKPQMNDIRIPIIDIVEGIEDEGTTMLLSEVAKDITFIPLETTDECLIGSIYTIHLSLDYLIIVDSNPYQILLFNKTGKFIRKIGSIGQGPCEYLCPELSVLVNDELFVWDRSLNKTFCFDLHTGKCLRTKKHDMEPCSMDYFNDSILVYYYSFPTSGDPQKFAHIQTLSLDFETANEYWHEKFQSHIEIMYGDYSVSTYLKDGNLYVWDSNVENGTVYYLDKNFKKNPAYQLYLGKYNSYKKSSGDRYEMFIVRETDRFLFIGGILFEKRHAVRILYDKTTGKSKNIIFNLEFNDWGFHNDIDGSIPFWICGYIAQNILYDFITPSTLKELMSHPYYKTIDVKNKEKHQAIVDYLDSAEEDANPIIFLVTMKTK